MGRFSNESALNSNQFFSNPRCSSLLAMTQTRQDSPTSDPRSLAQFDTDGVPLSTPVGEWLDLSPPIASRWLQAILRFSRTDGSVIFGPTGRSSERLRALDAQASKMGDPSLTTLLGRWLPKGLSSKANVSPPPLPSDSRPDRPLAILRADWTPRSEYLAVDHRLVGPNTLFEFAAKGEVWLGPSWTSTSVGQNCRQPRPTSWTANAYAESLEWSLTSGKATLSRVVTLLRGRSMAVLGQQVEGPGLANEIRLSLPLGVDALSIPGSRSLQLSRGPGKPAIRLHPIGLLDRDRPTVAGSIAIEGREIVIRQESAGKQSWLPVLLTWGKPPTGWRPLTVACRSKVVRLDQASAVRVAWGVREPGLVIYRSLGPPELRSFLGHQTSASYVIGSFTRAGDLATILKVNR